MKFPTVFRKPRWQSRDPRTRLAAVLADHEGALLASLGRIAREDSDAQVRLAAMKRLGDPGIAHGMAHDDADPHVRVQARALWRDILAGAHASAPPVSERLRLLAAQDDVELLEWMARNGREVPVRRAALARITRPALLLERALEDSDACLRSEVVDRIDDEAQLARLAERARKLDKQVSRRARERIESLRMARGDGAMLDERARRVCERLERLLRDPGVAAMDAQSALELSWLDLGEGVPAALQARFDAARSLLAASRTPRAAIAAEVPVPPTQEPAGESPADTPASSPAAVAAPLLAQARFAASLDEARAEAARRRECDQALEAELEDAERSFAVALESGATAQAHALKTRVDALHARVKAVPRALAGRLAASEARYAEVVRWQHWADDQRRRQLCEEVEALPGSGLHPDAVAAKVRDAQGEWARLDALEGGHAPRGGGFGRRFHAACRAAIAPARTYFLKRQELRAAHARVTLDLLARADELPTDCTDRNALVALRREVALALRALDQVEPRERKQLAQRLKDALGALDTRLARCDEAVEQARAALIGEALRLAQPGQHGAAAAARELQQRWQQVGHGRRAREQEQWQAFRAAIDAVFAQLDSARAERVARDGALRERAIALCTELESAAVDDNPGERAARSRIQAEWDALRVTDDALLRRFAAARAQMAEVQTRRERARRTARFDAWRERYRLCRQLEDARIDTPAARARWDGTAPAGVADLSLDARFRAALDGSPPDAPVGEEHAAILRALECLGGVESPPDERERRRELQVARLSARLRGDGAASAPDELADLIARWTVLAPAPSLDARFDCALESALATLA